MQQCQQILIDKAIEKGLSRYEILEILKTQRDTAKLTLQEPKCFARNTVKRSVMVVSAYNAQLTTVRSTTVEQLSGTSFIKKAKKEHISCFSKDIYHTILNCMESSTAYKTYAGNGLKHRLKTSTEIYYRAPLTNFPVCIKINHVKSKRVQYQLPSTRKAHVVMLNVNTKETNNRKTTSSGIPSIIHSLDAAILLSTQDKFNGLMATIHDSYGTHLEDVPALKQAINTSLVDMYKVNALPFIFNQLDYNEDSPTFDLDDTFVDIIQNSQYGFN